MVVTYFAIDLHPTQRVTFKTILFLLVYFMLQKLGSVQTHRLRRGYGCHYGLEDLCISLYRWWIVLQ